jgi:hypothetical protein
MPRLTQDIEQFGFLICRWSGDLSGVGQGPLRSVDARREFWVFWRSLG